NVVIPSFECLENLRPVGAFPVDLSRPKSARLQDLGEFLAGSDQRQEHQGFAPLSVFEHLVSDLLQVRIERRPQLPRREVAVLHGHLTDVKPEWYSHRPDRREVALSDRPGQRVLVGEAVEKLAKISHVSPIWRGRYSEYLGVPEMVQYPLIALGQHVLCLVD